MLTSKLRDTFWKKKIENFVGLCKLFDSYKNTMMQSNRRRHPTSYIAFFLFLYCLLIAALFGFTQKPIPKTSLSEIKRHEVALEYF